MSVRYAYADTAVLCCFLATARSYIESNDRQTCFESLLCYSVVPSVGSSLRLSIHVLWLTSNSIHAALPYRTFFKSIFFRMGNLILASTSGGSYVKFWPVKIILALKITRPSRPIHAQCGSWNKCITDQPIASYWRALSHVKRLIPDSNQKTLNLLQQFRLQIRLYTSMGSNNLRAAANRPDGAHLRSDCVPNNY